MTTTIAALAWRNQDWEPDRDSSDGRMGWHFGWESERAYEPSLEEIRPERGEINLGRGSGCCCAGRACEAESTHDGGAHTGGTGGIAKGPGRRTSADDGFRRWAPHRIAVDASRTLLPPECTRQARTTPRLSSPDLGSKIGIVSRVSNSDRRRNWRDH